MERLTGKNAYRNKMLQLSEEARAKGGLYSCLYSEYIKYKMEQLETRVNDIGYKPNDILCFEGLDDKLEVIFERILKQETKRCLNLFINKGKFGKIDFRKIVKTTCIELFEDRK